MSLTFLGHVEGKPQKKTVVKIPLSSDPVLVERFAAEIETLRTLRHDGVVQLVAHGKATFPFDDGRCKEHRPYFVMNYIAGQNLGQVLKAKKRLTWPEVRQLLRDVADSLAYLRRQGVCHRDIKPDNLIFDSVNRRWVLVDFGIAKSLLNNARLAKTLAAQNPGSWDYMSPEQLEGKTVDCRSDIYSLGKTAWEALIGQTPRVGTPYPSSELGDDQVPRDVDTLLAKMLAHKPEERYQTPEEFLRAMKVGARAIQRRQKTRRFLGRITRRVVAAAIVAAALVGGWVAGNFITGERANEIAGKRKSESPTLAIRDLEQFRFERGLLVKLFRWGDTAIDEAVAELEPAAREERKNMEKEYQATANQLNLASVALSTKRIAAENFLKEWEERFKDSDELRDIRLRAEEVVFLIQKEDDDKLWVLCKDEADSSLRDERFSDAQAAVKRYQDNSPRKPGLHSEKAAELSKKIASAKDSHEWKSADMASMSHLKTKNFGAAVKAVKDYLKSAPKGPNSVAANGRLSFIGQSHYEHCLKIQSIGDLNYEISQFKTLYPDRDGQQLQLKRGLALLVWNNIDRITLEKTADAVATLEGLYFTECERAAFEYLDSLRSVARTYLQNQSYQHHLDFLWKRERLPSSVGILSGPTVFRKVTITAIEVSMSEDYYKRLKGGSSADPRIDLHLGKGDRSTFQGYGVQGFLREMKGPKNQKSFVMNQSSNAN
ncbi:MAG TPA: serine/threonine-protein kinase, partial [Gemmataceae bacterium]|nr:serine/threonine-protein kinase [Gemmataceae bacterium]